MKSAQAHLKNKQVSVTVQADPESIGNVVGEYARLMSENISICHLEIMRITQHNADLWKVIKSQQQELEQLRRKIKEVE
jgi:hypothetical protein